MNSKKIILIFFILIFLFAFFYYINIRDNTDIIKNGQSNYLNKENIEENIKNAFLKKYSNWGKDDFDIFIEDKLFNYAIGAIIWDKNVRKAFWLAANTDNEWEIVNYSGGGYFGACQDFEKYNFPAEITPDCWDEEQKILINSPNPNRFYNGLTIEDKEKIKQAFLDFKKDDTYFQNKKIYVNFNKVIDEYLRGIILIGGIDNYSAPHFFAVKNNNDWRVVYYGQEDPPCENIKDYNFPIDMISKCWRGEDWIKR